MRFNTEKQKKDLETMRQQIQSMAEEYEENPEHLAELAQFSARFHRYSVRNQMLLQKQNPDAVFVGSFEKFHQLGYSVRRGEHGMKIFVPAPVTLFQSEPDGDWKTLSEADETEKEQLRKNLLETKKILYFKVGTVFDLSQTNCPKEDYPKIFSMGFFSNQHREIWQGLTQFCEEKLRCPVVDFDLKSISKRGCYYPQEHKIFLNDRLEDSQKVSVLAHEMGHALLHREVDRRTTPLSKIELQADFVSIMLQTHFGVEIPDSRKAHLAEHYRNYRQHCEENRDTENADFLLECFQSAANVYKENIDEIDQSIAQQMEKEQAMETQLESIHSEDGTMEFSVDFAPQELQDLYQDYQDKLQQPFAEFLAEESKLPSDREL